MELKESRWKVLTLYTAFSLLMGAAWCPFSSVAEEASDYYGVRQGVIDTFELSFLALYALTAIPTTFLLHASLQKTIIGATALLSIGSGVRYFAGHSFIWALTGQIIIASANCASMSSCSTIANLWFPPTELIFATAIASLSTALGAGMQLIVSPVADNIPRVLGVFALISFVVLIAVVVFFDADPPHPPTSLEWADIRAYLRNWSSMRFLFFTGSAYGICSALVGIIDKLVSSSGYSEIESGAVGLAVACGGMVGGVSSSAILAHCENHSTALRAYLILGVVSSIGICVAELALTSMLIVSFFYGFGIIGFLPLAIQTAIDESPSIDSSIPPNVIFFIGQVLALIYSYPAAYFNSFTGFSGLTLLAGFTVLSVGLFLVFYESRRVPKGETMPLQAGDSLNKCSR